MPLDAPGVRVRTIKSIDGKESFCEVFFDDVEVSQADALGAPDEGWAAAIRVLEIERATNRMYRAWRFENELRHLISACKTDPVLAELLADRHYAAGSRETVVDIEVLKAHVETAVDALVNGDSIGARGSLAKLHWSEAHQRFAALAMELLSKASLPLAPRCRWRGGASRHLSAVARRDDLRRHHRNPARHHRRPDPRTFERQVMTMTDEGLSPAEFAATAARAVAACTGLTARSRRSASGATACSA